MPGTAQIALDPPRALLQQAVVCTAELKNTGRAPLESVNPLNKASGPTIVLTELATGLVSRFSARPGPGVARIPISVPTGESFKLEFVFQNMLKPPGPGKYQVQAHYTWDGGEAISAPASLEIIAARPESAHIVSAYGAAGPLYFAAWLNAAPDPKQKRELWFSTIAASRKPIVEDSVLLMEFAGSRAPTLSIPPAQPPVAQWLAWTGEGKLWFCAHKKGAVSQPNSAPLDHPDTKILPPVLLNPAERGRTLPGADVLLAEPKPDGAASLRILRLSLSHPAEWVFAAPLPPTGTPAWTDTAALASGMRYTHFAQPDRGRTALHQFTWTHRRPDGTIKPLETWPGACLAGAQWLTPDNQIVGVLLLRSGEFKRNDYCFQHWTISDKGAFQVGRTVPFIGADRTEIMRASVSINIGGDAHALIATDPTEQTWQYVTADGALHDLPPDAQPFALPAQVLYRRMEDPTIMFSRPPLGFEFAKPD